MKPLSRLPPWARYLVGAVAATLTVLLRLAFVPLIGTEIPIFLILPLAIFATWFLGLGPGLLASFLALAGTILSLRPFAVGPYPPIWLDSISVTLIIGLVIASFSFLTARLRAKYNQGIEAMVENLDLEKERAAIRIFRNMAASAPVGVFLTDRSGACTYVNSKWTQLAGLPAERALGDGWKEAVHHDDCARMDFAWKKVREARMELATEFRFHHSDGTVCWAFVNAAPITDAFGNLEGYVGYTIDITDRKRLEDQINHSLKNEIKFRQEAERLNTIKDHFLATLSHELRTPIGVIVGWSELLKEGALNPDEQKTALAVIARNAKSEATIVDDLLDLSRIVTGKISLEKRIVDLSRIAEDTLESLSLSIGSKQLRIDKFLTPETCSVYGDPDRLRQIVWNLLNNAVKFTSPNGHIKIEVSRRASHVVLKVSDNGIGMAPEQVQHLFEPFWQADAGMNRKFGGLGLGLALAQRLVSLHGGTIRADSPGPGQGSVFIVDFPVPAVRQTEAESALPETALPSNALQGVKILVVDDEPDARLFIEKALSLYGARVTATESAEAALKNYRKIHPDIIVSDLGMPEMNGFELIQKLRREESPGEHHPAIALTAYGGAEYQSGAKESGFDYFLSKPIEPSHLVSMISFVLQQFTETDRKN